VRRGPLPPPSVRLGVVVPTLNEEGHLSLLLDDLRVVEIPPQVVVSDGGSTDGTLREARARGAQVVEAGRGRSRQLNAGARILSTEWLLFLHADVRIPPPSIRAMESWLAGADPGDFGTFGFTLQGRHWFWRFIELGQGLRERITGLAYGDQGLLVSRSLFERVGGYPDLPIMEDVDILRRLRKKGRWVRIPAPALSSPRRYQEEGRWTGWIRNTVLVSLYLAGVSPHRLARFYPARLNSRREGQEGCASPAGPAETGERVTAAPAGPAGGPPDSSGSPVDARHRGGHCAPESRLLLVFAKEPVPGRVKTRLAAAVGDRAAARIYHEMGRRIVDGLRGGDYRIRVCFDPPDGRAAVEEWLDPAGLEFHPQAGGDLGARLEAAFRDGFARAGAVVAIGTDAPDVGRSLVERAFTRLAHADLVLGPARDGGYYLLGLKEPNPALFREIPWSTPGVLDATRERAESSGLTVYELPVLADVDTVEDLEASGFQERGRS